MNPTPHLIGAALLVTIGQCSAEPITLQNGRVLVEVDPSTGVLVRVRDESSGVDYASPEAKVESYKLLLAKSDKSTVVIQSRDQKLTAHTSESGKTGVMTLRWDGPLKDTTGAEHKITVRMEIRTTAKGVEFILGLDNNSDLVVKEVQYPFVGGVQKLGSDASAWVPISTPWQKPLQGQFGNNAWGYPGQMNLSFTCIESKSANKSIYFSANDKTARHTVYYMSGPTDDSTDDVVLHVSHFPFTKPGDSFVGSAVQLRFLDGDHKAAGAEYREWFKTAFGLANPKHDWIRNQSFFLFTMFMLPEGTINVRFKDIPQWAKAAKDHGIDAVQISGWQLGGHDNGYPAYVPDPRLGTWEELEAGIRACHKMGLKVYFFVNYQPMMLESDWYKNDLQKYREMAENGGLTWNAGWGMGTLAARMGEAAKKMTWADPAFPQFRKIIVDQFAKLAEIGADGVHVDKMFPTAIDYNPDIPLSPDSATWEGAIQLSKEIMAECRKRNPNWAMSFETNWDRMLQFGCATWWVGNQLVTRSIFPEHAETTSITMAYDYLGINNLVRNGHVVMVASMSFARGMDWPPFAGLADYIRDLKRIRDSLQETVFFGEVTGHDGVELEGSPAQGIDYNVFRSRTTGRHVCIMTNSSREPQGQVIKSLGKGAAIRIHTPGKKSFAVMLPTAIEIPAERLIFVEELEYAPPDALKPFALPKTKQEPSTVTNGDFETGTFDGWTADPNWVIASDSCHWYSGWQGKYWAWSGGMGEPAMGKLTSKPFLLDKDGVRLMISGWNSVNGSGNPRRWNYVTLNLADGTELDRVYAPNTTAFVPALLNGSGHKGKMVYVQAVDDADQPTFSMLCIDDVRTADLPAENTEPAPKLPAFDAKQSVRIENDSILVDISRANGSVSRIHDKKSGLDLILEPRLAGSWTFALPIPGKEPWETIEANWIKGREQKLTSYEIDGSKIALHWNGPLKNYLAVRGISDPKQRGMGEQHDVSVTETIELTDSGALFSLHIDNRTRYQVGETYFPQIGGIRGLGKTQAELRATHLVRPAADGKPTSADIFRTFGNMSPFGDQGPELFYEYPKTQPEPWAGLSSSKLTRSVYVGAQDPVDRKKVVRLELLPSSAGTPREDGNWPRPEELKGMPVGVELSLVDCAGGAKAKDYDASPVLVKFIDGGEAEMHSVYAAWNAKK